MKTTPTKLRRAVRGLLWLFALAVVAIVLLPVWFPWLLKPVLGQFGIRFDTYDRLGYTRFSLAGVKGAWPNTTLEANRVESVLPAVWLWQRFQRDTNGAPVVTVSDWRVWVGSSDLHVRGQRTHSMLAVLDEMVPIATVLRREVPLARLTNGVVEGEGWRIALPDAVWREGRVSGELRVQSFPETIQVSAVLENKSTLSLAASLDVRRLGVAAKLHREPTAWRLQGQATWLTNRAELWAKCDQTGWWPAVARLEAERLRVPAELVRLPGYQDPTASLVFNLVSNQFQLQATAAMQPSPPPETAALPGVEAVLRIRGHPGASYHQDLGGGRLVHFGVLHAVSFSWGGDAAELPFNKRFFPGGENSVRGYQQGEASPLDVNGDQLGAETFTQGNLEFEQLLTRSWSVVAFFDAVGFARERANYPWDEWLYSVGGGIRWHSLIGPVRLEYGHNLSRRDHDPAGTLHFSIGYPF